jgi:hypothetical protein
MCHPDLSMRSMDGRRLAQHRARNRLGTRADNLRRVLGPGRFMKQIAFPDDHGALTWSA